MGYWFDRVCDWHVLKEAFARVQRGKRSCEQIVAFRSNLDENIAKIKRQLEEESFEWGSYNLFKVYDPKERTIAAAPVKDRVVHHALIYVLGDIFDKSLIDRTYACRKGLGQWAAIETAQRLAKKHEWCLKLDMKKYFDSIDHGILFGMLQKKFHDAKVLNLFGKLIESYETEKGKGLPIGNLTSQYFANMYLGKFDRWLDDKACGGVLAHVRYMDDILVFGEKDVLKGILAEAPLYLDDVLKLELKAKGGLHRMVRGVDFLGTRLFPDTVRLNRRSKVRYRRKMRYLAEALEAGEMEFEEYACRRVALDAFIAHTDSEGFRRKVKEENERGRQPSPSRRQQEQQCEQLPFSEPQQQQPVQRQQQQRVAFGCYSHNSMVKRSRVFEQGTRSMNSSLSGSVRGGIRSCFGGQILTEMTHGVRKCADYVCSYLKS